MMRTWIGLALLAASWLAGVGYYSPASRAWWTAALVASVFLLARRPGPLPSTRSLGVASLMLIPAAWLLSWPYRAWPLLMIGGLGLQMAPIPRRWPKAVGWGAIRAGLVLLSLTLMTGVYAACTARSHDLPGGLAWLLGAVTRLVGLETAVDGTSIVIHSVAHVHRLTATWDLLIDPATLGFLVGGMVLLALPGATAVSPGATAGSPGATAGLSSSASAASTWKTWLRAAGNLAFLMAAWLPIRAGLLTAVMLERGLRADPDLPLGLMNQFFDARVYLLSMTVPVLLAWRFVRIDCIPRGDSEADNVPSGRPEKKTDLTGRRFAVGIAAICVSATLVSILVHWDPVGRPKQGRIMFVERHSEWEPTDRPYDTESFGEGPSYSYTRIYDYCGQYFETSRLLESDPIDDAKLAECDVLVIKTPTTRYSAAEVAAVERFVASGGGLLLIGEHTNVDLMSTYLNENLANFGFKFRHDLLYRVGSPFVQWVTPRVVPHPAVQRVPPIRYAVSCSIDPGRSPGRAAVGSTGLWNLPPDYNSENFFPQAHYRADMRFGAFIQLRATRHGSGRVMAFTDSTIFSNFSTFEPGKPDLMIGMLQWLNQSSWLDDGWLRCLVVVPLFVVAVAGLVIGRRLCRGRSQIWPVILAACTFGWFLAAVGVKTNQQWTMPPLENQRPMVRVVLDRTVSDAPLSEGGFAPEDGLGYALVEQWISRLGCYTTRQAGPGAFSGDALVIIAPTLSVSEAYRESLVEYVSAGGNVLIFDSPDVENTTANSLLWPFGLEIIHSEFAAGTLHTDGQWPGIELEAVCRVRGGEPFVWVDDVPVAARADYGQGSVTAVGFGSLMNDANMGYSWMPEPDEMQRTIYDLLFVLVRSVVED